MTSRVLAVVAPVAVVVLVAGTPVAQAGVLWNENSSGDLSDNWLAPTPTTLSLGSNTVAGTTGERDDGSVDRDYFTIFIPAGVVLSEILHVDYFSNDQVAFIGVQAGSVMPDPNTVGSDSLLGWSLFGPSTVGTDMFDGLSTPRYPGGGFFPLATGPATYTFWVQQTGENTLYEFDFVTIPSPGAAGLAGFGLLASLRRRR
jgi:hypothetical protein